MIKFEIDGREVDISNISDVMTEHLFEGIKDHIHKRIGALKNPVTGESPVVLVKGKSLDNLAVEIEGSPGLIEAIKNNLNEGADLENNAGLTDSIVKKEKTVFLCHGSEDKEFVRKLATDLSSNGVKVFFDEWEIGPGDSIRKKIDLGLEECTHFIVVLTSTSINKPWVNVEIDAAFVQSVEKSVSFIPIRLNLPVNELSPLLRSKHAPSFDQYEDSFKNLLSTIYGISKKPKLGPVPPFVQRQVEGTGLSAAAEAIIRIMVNKSETGYSHDPLLTPEAVRTLTSLADDDIIDGVDELEVSGLVCRHHALGEGEIGFIYLSPENELFVKYDRYFKEFTPEEDALHVAAEVVNSESGSINVKQVAMGYGWEPRRMNPAINYLINRNLVETGNEMGSHPWATFWVRKIPATRRFVKDRS